MTPPRATSLPHVPELDAVRGIAFLLVFLAHLWPGALGWDRVNTLARYGWIGVDLFFVLSGFLITSILWRERAAPYYFSNFYMRRALRILPPFYLLIFVLWALNTAAGGLMPPAGQNMHMPSVLPYHFLLYLFMLANVAGAIYGGFYAPLDVTWSLAVEEHFYLVWPLVVRKVPLRWLLWILGLIVLLEPLLRYAAARVGFTDEQIYTLTPFRLGGLALGALIALALANQLVQPAALRRTALWTLSVCGPVFVFLAATKGILPASESHRGPALNYSIISVLMACVLVLALFPGRLARTLFGLRPLQYVGKVSYGAYLYHWICAVLVNAGLRRIGVPIPVWNHATVAESVGYLFLVGAATLAAAAASWYLLERPILALKRYFSAWGRTPAVESKPTAPAGPGTPRPAG